MNSGDSCIQLNQRDKELNPIDAIHAYKHYQEWSRCMLKNSFVEEYLWSIMRGAGEMSFKFGCTRFSAVA